MYDIQHCFICRPSDSTVGSEDAGIGPRTVATTALAVRRSKHSARSHPHFDFNSFNTIRLNNLISLKTDVYVPTVSNKQKKLQRKETYFLLAF
jgi:hypothetical protein